MKKREMEEIKRSRGRDKEGGGRHTFAFGRVSKFGGAKEGTRV